MGEHVSVVEAASEKRVLHPERGVKYMDTSGKGQKRRGALVISLDFELQWGVYGRFAPDSPYRENILGARRAIPQILDLFEEFEIAATWATVGFLFAHSREELFDFAPAIRPAYKNRSVNPYTATIGKSEEEDPLHFAPSLIREIQTRRGQEIGSHTFSHFYCLEPGATVDALRSDLESAVSLASARGIRLSSIVFPRNQVTREALRVLPELGFRAYRGRECGWMYDARPQVRNQMHRRLGRLVEQQCVPDSQLVDWAVLANEEQLSNIRGSLFLRPFSPKRSWLDAVRLDRLTGAIWRAATTGRILHLWWHPHNFGRNTDLNLAALRRLLMVYAECRDAFGFQSLSMADAAAAAQHECSLPVALPATVATAGL